jgi:AcrR family transcriptional regulator
MSIKDRREREKKQLRENILGAAQKIINKEGFKALSMRKLAEQIEYSPGAIYLHFQNRNQIAQELALAGYGQLFEELMAASQPKGLADRVKNVGLAYVSFGLKHPETYRLIFMGDAEYMEAVFTNPTPDHPAGKCYQILTDIAEALKNQGHYTGKLTPNEIADTIWAALHGIVSLKLGCEGLRTPAEDLTRIMMTMLASGFASSKASKENS